MADNMLRKPGIGRGLSDGVVVALSETEQLRADVDTMKHIASELHWMARRYADGRRSTAPSSFNQHTRALVGMGVTLNPTGDGTIWARDGMGRAFDGLSENEAAEGRAPDWWHSGPDAREQIEQLTADLAAERSARAALAEAALAEAADGVADASEALLNHYYRHTTHRCEIDREAEEALAAYRALLDQQPCRAAAPAVDEGQVEQCASICSAHQVRKAGCRLCHAVFRTPAAAGQGEG